MRHPGGEDDAAGEAFWRFSLALYARPGVADALITIQDRAARDVNLILSAFGSERATVAFSLPASWPAPRLRSPRSPAPWPRRCAGCADSSNPLRTPISRRCAGA